MPSPAFDVVIAGGGPAGAAAGLSLRSHAPGLSVALVEASGYEGPRLGETLPPAARPLLAHLGVWEAFRRQGHAEVCGTVAAWGSPAPYENDHLYSLRGNGWHLDRAGFDAMLAREAEARGVRRLRGRVSGAVREGETWRLSLAVGGELSARFLVDATGAAATLARRCGARFVALDRLAGYTRFFAEPEGVDPRTRVEAFADGWWYTAGLPGGLRVAACLTDADLGRRLRLSREEDWSRLLGAARLGELLRGARPVSPVVVKATPSRRLEPAAGEGWLAVGDAASLFDPLSSSGITKALRGGIFASYAIGDLLVRGDEGGLERYRRFVIQELAAYAGLRSRYYARERRWPENEFWRRRGGELSGQLRELAGR